MTVYSIYPTKHENSKMEVLLGRRMGRCLMAPSVTVVVREIIRNL